MLLQSRYHSLSGTPKCCVCSKSPHHHNNPQIQHQWQIQILPGKKLKIQGLMLLTLHPTEYLVSIHYQNHRANFLKQILLSGNNSKTTQPNKPHLQHFNIYKHPPNSWFLWAKTLMLDLDFCTRFLESKFSHLSITQIPINKKTKKKKKKFNFFNKQQNQENQKTRVKINLSSCFKNHKRNKREAKRRGKEAELKSKKEHTWGTGRPISTKRNPISLSNFQYQKDQQYPLTKS